MELAIKKSPWMPSKRNLHQYSNGELEDAKTACRWIRRRTKEARYDLRFVAVGRMIFEHTLFHKARHGGFSLQSLKYMMDGCHHSLHANHERRTCERITHLQIPLLRTHSQGGPSKLDVQLVSRSLAGLPFFVLKPCTSILSFDPESRSRGSDNDSVSSTHSTTSLGHHGYTPVLA